MKKVKIKNETIEIYKEFKVTNDRIQVFSSGLGTQSCGIAVMIYLGILPKPDLIVAADTGRESSQAIEYNKKHIAPLMEEIGVPFLIVHKDSFPELGKTYDLIDEDPKTKTDVLLPMFIDDGVSSGKASGFCSSLWKTQTVHRAVNKFFGSKETSRRGVDQWIGMSIDEYQRVKFPEGKWQKKYPLVDMALNRQQVISISEKFGLPTPPRSACFMCPNKKDEEWIDMKENAPEDFKMAIEVEKHIHKQGYDEQFLHSSCVPLGEVIFKTGDESQMDMFNCSGICFT
ncbi:putative ribosomal L7Ae/L30e/S12e/Gadd45 family protein [Vibrio phage 434O48-1]|nr:putative ribosomal L7Ae/L30e/S12e/Gadd45 family protein [Vibrio phage 434O48-1]